MFYRSYFSNDYFHPPYFPEGGAAAGIAVILFTEAKKVPIEFTVKEAESVRVQVDRQVDLSFVMEP